MLKECSRQTVKISFLKYEEKAYNGQELKEFALQNYTMNKEDDADKLMNDLLNMKIIHPLKGKNIEFKDSLDSFYIFQEDLSDVSDNMFRIFQGGATKDALELSKEIIGMANEVLKENKFVDFVEYEEMRELNSYIK